MTNVRTSSGKHENTADITVPQNASVKDPAGLYIHTGVYVIYYNYIYKVTP